MRYPGLTKKRASTMAVTEFYGVDARIPASGGWLNRAVNFRSDGFPLLCTRRPRGRFQKPEGMGGVTAGVDIEGRFCAVDGHYVWVGGHKIDMGLTEGKKLLVPFSFYLLIWPDKVYVNVLNIQDHGSLTGREQLFPDGIYVQVCDKDGNECLDSRETAPTAIENPAAGIVGVYDGYLWLKPRDAVNGTEPVLYKAEIIGEGDDRRIEWTEVEAYLKFRRASNPTEEEGLYPAIGKGETVILCGFENPMMGTVTAADKKALNGAHVVETVRYFYRDGEGKDPYLDEFMIRGIIGTNSVTFGASEDITVERAIPDLDFATVFEGRVYGAFRGMSHVSGVSVNEIYISGANNFRSYYKEEGTAADPLVMSVAEPGEFRGAAVVGSRVTFFKDRKILEVGGSSPESFYLQPYDGRGPTAGDEGSLTVIDSRAYYKAGGDILCYCGGSASVLSERLGDGLRRVRAVAGCGYGYHYYLATEDGICVLDTLRGTWVSEDLPPHGVASLVGHADGLYMLTRTGDVWTVGDHDRLGGVVPSEEAAIPWLAETGTVGLDSPIKKYISRADVRLTMGFGATAELWVQYDSASDWRLVWRAEDGPMRAVRSVMIPHRCDHLKLRLRGTGEVAVTGIFYTIERAGD